MGFERHYELNYVCWRQSVGKFRKSECMYFSQNWVTRPAFFPCYWSILCFEFLISKSRVTEQIVTRSLYGMLAIRFTLKTKAPVILPVYVHEIFFCNNIRAGIHTPLHIKSRKEIIFQDWNVQDALHENFTWSYWPVNRLALSLPCSTSCTVRHNYCSHLAGWGRISLSLSLSLDRDRAPFVVSHDFRSLCGTLPLPLPWTCFLY